MILPKVIKLSVRPKRVWKPTSMVVAVAVLSLAACTSVPKSELSQYQAAFAEANTAKDGVLIDFDTAISEAQAFIAANENTAGQTGNKSPFPTALNGTESLSGPDATELRRATWRVVERYNAVLGDLAEGKSEEEVKNAVGGFGNSIGKFIQAATGSAIPGLGALIEVAQTVAGEVENARRAEEFKRAVRHGRPLVDKILDALYEDANDQYTIRLAIARDAFNVQTSALTTSIGDLYLLMDSHQSPTANLDGEEFLSSVNERLNAATLPLANQLLEFPFTLAWAEQSGAPFTPAAKNTVELRLVGIEQRTAAMVALVQEVGGIRDTLRAYQTLLTKIKDALIKLDHALDAPVNIENEADEILATVFKIKQGIEKYRVAREKASAAKPPVVSSAPADSR